MIKPAVKASLFWRTYESAEIRFVRKYLRRDLDVVELGAGIGVVTCHLRSLANKDRKVISVEANPMLMSDIQHNLALNGLWENVFIVHGAIDYSDATEVQFAFAEHHTGGKIQHSPKGHATTTSVPTLTLKQILNENQLSEFTLVMDIEGEESNLIKCDSESLAACRQIIAEFHNSVIDGEAITVQAMADELIQHYGFKIVDQYGPVFVFERH